MKKGTKIVIGVVITFLLIIGLVVGGLVGLVFYQTHLTKKNNQRIEQAEIDGREFGKTTDQNGCMEKGFTLPVPIQNNGSDLSKYSFIGECLKSSRPTPDFCEGVPLLYDRKWFDEQCQKVGQNPLGYCSVAFSTKRTFCLRSNEYKSK